MPTSRRLEPQQSEGCFVGFRAIAAQGAIDVSFRIKTSFNSRPTLVHFQVSVQLSKHLLPIQDRLFPFQDVTVLHVEIAEVEVASLPEICPKTWLQQGDQRKSSP